MIPSSTARGRNRSRRSDRIGIPRCRGLHLHPFELDPRTIAAPSASGSRAARGCPFRPSAVGVGPKPYRAFGVRPTPTPTGLQRHRSGKPRFVRFTFSGKYLSLKNPRRSVDDMTTVARDRTQTSEASPAKFQRPRSLNTSRLDDCGNRLAASPMTAIPRWQHPTANPIMYRGLLPQPECE